LSHIAQSAMNDAGYRWTLALIMALGLHGAVLFIMPMDRWTFRFPTPQRFEVALLPPETAVLPSTPKPVSKPISEPEIEPAPVPKPEPKPAPKPEPKPVPKPEPEPEPASAPKPAPKPEPKPIPKPVPKPVPKPIPKLEPKPVPKPESKLRPKMVKPVAENKSSPPTPLPPAGERSARLPPKPTDSAKRPKTLTSSPGRLNSSALLSQVARLETEHQRQQSAGVRTQRVTLTDTRSMAGFYAADWARKVTRVGEMNFPDVARRLSLSTGPLLEVAIRADGSLREVRILRSSGNAELDQAARRIVKLAAPYPPFSANLRQQADLLRIESPWRFDPGGRVRAR